MSAARSVWRARAGLFGVLLVLLVANVVVLVVYSAFYDARAAALKETERQLSTRRDEAAASAVRAHETQTRLTKLREDLESFYGETLGARRERLAPLIQEIYDLTAAAGMRPDTFHFSEAEAPGTDRVGLAFDIHGRYPDIKRLLATFETNQEYLVLEGVAVATDGVDPDALKVNLTVAHYFRSDTSHVPKGTRTAARRTPAQKTVAKPRTSP